MYALAFLMLAVVLVWLYIAYVHPCSLKKKYLVKFWYKDTVHPDSDDEKKISVYLELFIFDTTEQKAIEQAKLLVRNELTDADMVVNWDTVTTDRIY